MYSILMGIMTIMTLVGGEHMKGSGHDRGCELSGELGNLPFDYYHDPQYRSVFYIYSNIN